jgi:hypothetical protein
MKLNQFKDSGREVGLVVYIGQQAILSVLERKDTPSCHQQNIETIFL